MVAAPCPAAGTWKLSCHLSVKILHVLFVGLLLFIKISLGVVVLLLVWSGQVSWWPCLWWGRRLYCICISRLLPLSSGLAQHCFSLLLQLQCQ